MGNIDKYDYEAKGGNVDLAVLAAEKRKRETIRGRILFTFKTFICHLAAVLLYLVVFANTGDFQSYYDVAEERIVLIIFSIIAVVIYGLIISIELSKNVTAREIFIKDRPFERKKRVRLALSNVIPYSVIYLIFQMPAAIYHLFVGYDYVETSIFEYFYVLDMGLMELTHVGVVGAILNTIIFAAALFVSNLLTCRRWQADEKRFEKGEKMKRKYG
ncbi:MAG: hypothetical protein IJX93_05760 [Clostridia bacterium]|nr:hypothetical protein [Clostridia bacterium]